VGIAKIPGESATTARREEENRHNPLPSIALSDRKANRRLRFRRRLRRLHDFQARFGLGFRRGRFRKARLRPGRLDLQARLWLRRLDVQAWLGFRKGKARLGFRLRSDRKARIGRNRKAYLGLAAGDDDPKAGAGKSRLDEKPSPVQDSLGVLLPFVGIVCLRLVFHGVLPFTLSQTSVSESGMGLRYGLWMPRLYSHVS